MSVTGRKVERAEEAGHDGTARRPLLSRSIVPTATMAALALAWPLVMHVGTAKRVPGALR
jgi:hypothetical protein